MPIYRRIAALLAVLAVGVAPGAALAQSGGAGNNQYVDPISGGNQSQPSHSGSGGSGSSSGSTSSPSPSTSPAPSASRAPSAAPAAAGTRAQTLPRTGLDAGVVAALGLALALMGLGLRMRLADERL